MTMARSKSKKKKKVHHKEYDGSPRNTQETIAALQGVFGGSSKGKSKGVTEDESGVLIDLPAIWKHATDKKRIAQEETAKLQAENLVLQEKLKQQELKKQNEALKKQLEETASQQ